MTTEAEKGSYPLASPDGKAIPFDIGQPTGLFIVDVAGAASAEKTLGADYDIVVILCTVDTLIGFGSGVVLNSNVDTDKANHLFCPAYTPVSIRVPDIHLKVMSADGVATGKAYIQKFRRWQALSTEALQKRIS